VRIRIYKTIILPAVLYGCITWSLILGEEYRLRLFQNKILKWVFGPKKDEVVGRWEKLRNQQFRDLYSLPSIIKEDEIGGAFSKNGEKRNAYIYWWENQRERDHYEDQDLGGG
jgi:hypothetical protein